MNFSRRLLCSGSTYVCIYGACIQSPRAPELAELKKAKTFNRGFGTCIFILRALYCDVTMIDQISPGSLTTMPFTLQLHPGAPGSLPGMI